MRYNAKYIVQRFLANHRTVAEAVASTTGLFTRTMRRSNVVMFHAGRCGSSVVGSLLNQHPAVKWGSEIFSNVGGRYGSQSWVLDDPCFMINLRTKIHAKKVFGFEIKDKHIDSLKMEKRKLAEFLESIGYDKYILLKRLNYLKRIISSKVAEKIGSWNIEKRVEAPSVEIQTKSEEGEGLIDTFKSLDRYYADIENIFESKNLLKLSYEKDVKDDPKKAYYKIIDYVGIEEEEVDVKYKKINKRPIDDRLSNYEEVKRYLAGSRYEWMLYE